MNRDQIIATLRSQGAALRRRGARDAALFGSVARGEARPGSDVDILIELDAEAPIGVFDYVAITQFLSDLFPVRVDVANRDGLKPLVRSRVEHDAVDGRMVIVVWTPTDDGRRLISMRKANDREQARYSHRLGTGQPFQPPSSVTDLIGCYFHPSTAAITEATAAITEATTTSLYPNVAQKVRPLISATSWARVTMPSGRRIRSSFDSW